MSRPSLEVGCGKESAISDSRRHLVSTRRWFPGVIAAVVLSSCASGAFYFGAYAPADYTPKGNQEYGVLLASIGMTDELDNRDYLMEFRRKDGSGGPVGSLNYPPTAGASAQAEKIEFKDAARRGIVISVRLRPGEYEIYRYAVQLHTWTEAVYVPWASKREFSVPFSIVAGRTTYLGQIMLDPGKREGLAVLVSGFDNTGIWAVSDKLERDMDLADKAGSPVIRANPLKEIPDPKELGLSDFRKDSP